MCIPGYELLRLAIERIMKKKHPFIGDNNHIHHLLLKNLGFKKTYFIIQFLLIIPYFLFLIVKNFFVSVLIEVEIEEYIFFFKKKKHKNI